MYREAAEYIKQRIDTTPQIGLILGSGLNAIANLVEEPIIIEYGDIPNFPVSTVEGHTGRFLVGKFANKDVIVMQGRLHYYEGYEPSQIVLPVRVMKLLGVDTLIITNAAGGIRQEFN